jgi:hypothetical protein
MKRAKGQRAQRLGHIAAFSLAALASCYLGLLVSHLLWDAPQLLVAAFTDAEVVSFGRFVPLSAVPYLYVLQPTDASPLAFAAYAVGAISVAPLLLAACVRFAGAVSGWLRLAAIHLAFWTGLLVAGAAVGFAGWGAGPLAGLASVVGGVASGAGRWILATLVLLACWLCLTRLLQLLAGEPTAPIAQRALRLTLWFLLPIVVLSATLSGAAWRLGPLQRLAGGFAPLLAAVLPVLAAIRVRGGWASPFQPTMRGAIFTAVAGAVCLMSMAAYPAVGRHLAKPEFDSLTSQHWELSFEQGALSLAERQAWAEAADHRLKEYSERLGVPLDRARLHSKVLLSTKAKRALTHDIRDDQPFTLIQEPLTLYQLLAPDGKLADPRGEPLLLMADAWGPPASQSVAEAVARYAAGGFLGRSLGSYARQITCEERPYTLAEVLGMAPHYLSPLVRDAVSGAWIESLVEDRGIEVLQRIYRAIPAEQGPTTIADTLGVSWNELQAAWQSYLTRTDAPCERPTRPANAMAALVHQGISLSHEVGGDWGYGSDSAQREIEKIRQIGANSVAIIPYAFTRAPEETSIRFRTDETDARVIRTIEQAKHAGLRVLLKPHLWGRGFTGDMKFTSDEDFETWWASYRRWLLHFARMAELYKVERLALGNELGGLTVREQPWRDLIRDVRRVYGGSLTYASHWSGEFERVAFWDQLDYIGVNAYFPLAAPAEAPSPDSSRVAEIRFRLAAVAGRFGKPVLFTEVGFPSMQSGAAEPWIDRSGAIDLAMQEDCYEVFFEAFAGQPWFGGTYWWKWPSHGRGGPYDLTHRPNGKPAMEVLRRWFQGNTAPDETQSRGR